MHIPKPLLALVLASGLTASHAAAQGPNLDRNPVRAGTAAAPAPARLPAVRARPPASRRNQPVPVPAARRAARATTERPNPARTPRLGVAPTNGEKWDEITPEAVNTGTLRLPVGRGSAGPTVLRVQIMLNRALFSPGMIDGKWGKNTENAVFWLQSREGLPTTGVVDATTYARLALLAGSPTQPVREHVLTAEDVAGPFLAIPGNIYEHARLRCSCYETLGEKLTETFHATRDLLRRLNPGVELDRVAAGAVLRVPNVRSQDTPPLGEVRKILVSGSGNYLQALDASGRILYHFAATLGSTYDPSPQGDFAVLSVHPNPWWHYQPALLAHVPDDRPNAMIPPGPNNAVGRVWIALSAPHYGIHGTKSPETIGYAQSAGCVRLTNWDVTFLSQRLQGGVP
ncbi:MAG TPA: L,D-transpeptidase family protein, partial [Longimicrobiaceae bacterium]|nr:L,D-transpeptidase family protein [Longimicrobiaceae bacterium]